MCFCNSSSVKDHIVGQGEAGTRYLAKWVAQKRSISGQLTRCKINNKIDQHLHVEYISALPKLHHSLVTCSAKVYRLSFGFDLEPSGFCLVLILPYWYAVAVEHVLCYGPCPTQHDEQLRTARPQVLLLTLALVNYSIGPNAEDMPALI